MRLPIYSLIVLCFLTLTTLTIQPAWSNYVQDPDEPEHSVLHRSMETLKHGQRALKKLIAEPGANQAEIMETLAGMERSAITALGELPPALEDVVESDRALHHVGFKRTMTTLLQALLTMEDAALRADAQALGAAYHELGRVKKMGHETYRDR